MGEGWRALGPSYSSERAHLETLLQELRFPLKHAVLWRCRLCRGYEFWRQIVDQGHSFLMRVGGNVRLLKGLGRVRQKGDIVYCWPDKAMKKKQLLW